MKTLLAVLSFAILLLCSGCEGFFPTCDTYTYDRQEWTEEEISYFSSAAENWNSFTGYPVISVSEGSRNHCQIHRKILEEAQGIHRAVSGNIDVMTQGLSGSELIQVTMHEMGHALGLHHVEDRHSIMSAHLTPSVKTFTLYDYAECKTEGVCN